MYHNLVVVEFYDLLGYRIYHPTSEMSDLPYFAVNLQVIIIGFTKSV